VYSGSHDEQWHSAPGFTVKNWAYDGQWDETTPYYRLVTGRLSRSSQGLNSFYCKYGKITFDGCGYLVSKWVAPGCIPDVQATFMQLHRDGVDLASGGDSGGPVYPGGTALGIVEGWAGDGIIDDLLYTAVNYVESGLGVTVLTSS